MEETVVRVEMVSVLKNIFNQWKHKIIKVNKMNLQDNFLTKKFKEEKEGMEEGEEKEGHKVLHKYTISSHQNQCWLSQRFILIHKFPKMGNLAWEAKEDGGFYLKKILPFGANNLTIKLQNQTAMGLN